VKAYFEIAVKSGWQYFKNRAPHARITKYALTIGGAILLGPLWQPLLIALISNTLDVTVEQTPAVYGLIIIGFALLFFFSVEFLKSVDLRNKKSDQRDCDKKTMEKLRALMSEQHADSFLSRVLNDHSYVSRDSTALCEIEEFVDSAETHFFTPNLADYAWEYREKSTDLMKFLALEFFPTRNLSRFVLFPAGNWDRGSPNEKQRKQYSALTKELEKKVKLWRDARNALYKLANENML